MSIAEGVGVTPTKHGTLNGFLYWSSGLRVIPCLGGSLSAVLRRGHLQIEGLGMTSHMYEGLHGKQDRGTSKDIPVRLKGDQQTNKKLVVLQTQPLRHMLTQAIMDVVVAGCTGDGSFLQCLRHLARLVPWERPLLRRCPLPFGVVSLSGLKHSQSWSPWQVMQAHARLLDMSEVCKA